MAIEKTIELNVDSKGAQADFGKLADAIQELNKTFSKFSEDTTDGLEDIKKSSKETKKGVGGISKGFKGLGVAMKAAGIGLVIAALGGLKDVFSQNQKVVDVFSTGFETFSIVANQVVGAIINVYEAVSKSSENFNGLGEVLGSLLKLSITPLKASFYAIKLALQVAQLTWEKSFFGDGDPSTIKALNEGINETKESLKEVGNDAIESSKNISNNIGDAINEVVNIGGLASEELSKINIKAAKEQAALNVKLKNSAELAAAQQTRLVEQYDLQAESLRQIRDEERLSITEREAANDKLLEVLEQQETAMLKQADLQVAAAQNEVNKNDTIEAQIELTNALANKEGVLAQIQGFRSEQKANDLALDRESIELTNSKNEAESNLSIERQRFNAEQIDDELLKLEALREIDLLYGEKEAERLQAIVDNANAETQAKIDAQIVLDEFNEQSRQTNLANKNAIDEAEKKIDTSKKEAFMGNLEAVSGALNGLSALAGENAEAQKGIGIAQAVIDTYVGATKALAQGGIAGPIAAAGVIASGLASVITIAKTKIPKPKGASGGGTSSASIPSKSSTPTPPSFNVVGASDTSVLADSVASQTNEPVQAYVVSNDVTTAQSLQNNIVEGATI
jgi:hypothetical protein